MTKHDELQQEIQDKVKPGVKPSHLKKARRADDFVPEQIKQELVAVQAQLTSKDQEIVQLKTELAKQDQELKEAREDINELTATNNQLLEQRLASLNKPDLTGQYQLCQEQKEQLEKHLNLAQQRIKNLQKKVNNSLANVLDKHLDQALWWLPALTLLALFGQ